MIPQLQQQLAELQAAFAELNKQTDNLREDISELRRQLEVGRLEQPRTTFDMQSASGPLVPPSHAGRRDR